MSKGHRGKRSELAQQRRDAKHLLLTYAYFDHEKAETVAMMPAQFYNEETVIKPYGQEFHYFVEAEIERGDVLVDSRGRGSFQKVVEVNH